MKGYMERKNIKKYRIYSRLLFRTGGSTRLTCLRLDSRYNMILSDSNHFISVTHRHCSAHKARTESPSQMYMFDKRKLACKVKSATLHSVSDCLDRLATARERTSSHFKTVFLFIFTAVHIMFIFLICI